MEADEILAKINRVYHDMREAGVPQDEAVSRINKMFRDMATEENFTTYPVVLIQDGSLRLTIMGEN